MSFLGKSFALLVLFSLGVSVGIYSPFSGSDTDAQLSAESQDVQFPPLGGTLALDGRRRFIYLPLNNTGVVPVSLASHMKPEDLIAGVSKSLSFMDSGGLPRGQ
jgi:hypothetical protein